MQNQFPGVGHNLKRFFWRQNTQVRKKLGFAHSPRELEPTLVRETSVFRAPPLSPELVATIRRISPQFRLKVGDEASRRFWELNQNGNCWGEFRALEPFLAKIAPAKVLDIGPGLGRSAVFFKKQMGWNTVPFHLYESTGESTKYTKAGPRFEDSFCGDLDVLRQVLDYNEIEEFEIFNAQEIGLTLSNLPGPYDFIYSFFAIGFHWAIEHFLDELLGLMTDSSVGVFTLHKRYVDLSAVEHLPHRVVQAESCWPRGSNWRLLVLAKTEAALQTAAVA